MNTREVASARGFVADFGLLLARIVIGVIFIAHGAQKLFEFTIPGVTKGFTQMGVPLPEVVAPVVAVLEFAGGIALIVGLFTRVIGALLTINMLAALLIVHIGRGVFVDGGGWELVGALGAASLVFATVGAGQLSIDSLFGAARRGSKQ